MRSHNSSIMNLYLQMIFSHSNKTKRILGELRHKARTAGEIFEIIFMHDPDTFKVTKRLLGYMTPPRKPDHYALRRSEEKNFYALLSKLRKEGIIKKQGIGMDAICNLTDNGFKKLLNYAEQSRSFVLPKRKYAAKKINSQTLIIFDIPESLKHCRNWIRYQLVALGFSMLQKSVWIGAYQIPSDLIHDLRESNLLQYIHIFKVTESGSIDR